MDGRAHPLASAFALLEGDDLEALVENIRENGLQEPVVVLRDGTILDWRNRYRACRAIDNRSPDTLPERARLRVQVVDLTERQQVELIVSSNLYRRHLKESQRAMIGARLRDHGNFAGLRISQKDRALALAVSPRTQRDADLVYSSGREDLIEAVQSGHLAVNKAAATVRAQRPKLSPSPPSPTPSPTPSPEPRWLDEHIVDRDEQGRQGASSATRQRADHGRPEIVDLEDLLGGRHARDTGKDVMPSPAEPADQDTPEPVPPPALVETAEPVVPYEIAVQALVPHGW